MFEYEGRGYEAWDDRAASHEQAYFEPILGF
jgi:hypothetical protein